MSTLPTLSDKFRKIEARNRFVENIVEEVKCKGYCSVSDLGHMDDQPEHPMMKAFRVLEEFDAAREGRRSHLVSPTTLKGLLDKACADNGWEINSNGMARVHYILAPLKTVECKDCNGNGRVHEPVRLDLSDLRPDAIMMNFTICQKCEGRGRITTRTSQ